MAGQFVGVLHTYIIYMYNILIQPPVNSQREISMYIQIVWLSTC